MEGVSALNFKTFTSLLFPLFPSLLLTIPRLFLVNVRKLDLSHLCFSLNFYFLMFLLQFPSMFLLLTYSQSLIPLSANHSRHPRQIKGKQYFDSFDYRKGLNTIL